MTEPPRASTAVPSARPAEKRAALPREFADFLIEFSIALHKHAMYPGGHPTLEPAAEGVARRLESLLLERGSLSLGVASDQLVIEGVATDPRNPVLHDLATRLHRHHLGAVSFTRGVTWHELEQALKVLAVESDRTGDPLGLRPREQIPRWPHLQLFPLTFERLELVGGPEGVEDGAAVSGGRAAHLWVGLARAALAADDRAPVPAPPPPPEPHAFRPVPAEPAAPLSDAESDAALSDVKAGEVVREAAEPAAVARAIESHERGTAYDQVIVGYLLQIADELKGTAGGPGAVALKKKMSKLVTNLDERTLGRLLEMGGDTTQRRQFLLDASQGMAVDAVVELVKAASGTGAPVSNAMLRMLQKLGQHAERGPTPRRTIAETELREQVAELVQGWELADPNPDGYALALQKMASAAPTLVAATEAAYLAEPERVVQMALESAGVGAPVERAVDELVGRGRVATLLDLLDGAPRDNAAVSAVRTRVVNAATLKAVLVVTPADLTLADRLVEALGPDAVEPLLDVLAESESRQVRRAVIDRLPRFGATLGPALVARLGDERWYVLRNVLHLAAELPGPPAVDAAPFLRHQDARVRREAMRVLLRQPGEARTRVLCAALADEDARVQRQGLTDALDGGCPEPAVPLVIALATGGELESEVRVSAIRVLGAKGGPLALDALLTLTEVRRRSIIGALMAGAASPETLAALAALGALRADPRARERLEAAGHSRDPAVQQAAAAALRGAE